MKILQSDEILTLLETLGQVGLFNLKFQGDIFEEKINIDELYDILNNNGYFLEYIRDTSVGHYQIKRK